MKKTIVLTTLLLICLLCPARDIPREKAAEIASDFLRKARPASTGSSGTSEPKLVKESAMYYVFERGTGGFAVISADDVAVPVLGYSMNGTFPADNVPESLQAMLDWYEEVIAFARLQGWEEDTVIKAKAAAESDREVRLNTAKWGQWSPFNDLSPIINGQKCPSGCTATAIAIVMKYHSCPKQGTGTLPGYDYGYDYETGKYLYHMDSQELGHEYDWDNMPENASGYTAYQSAQIAQLLFDVGVMCEMDFAPGGSGAYLSQALKLAKYFGYDNSIRNMERKFYSTSEWEQMIHEEINAGRPVLYAGYTDESGHAFVVDGYKGDYFSLNYGWSYGSAYFLLTPVEGHENELTDFHAGQSMVTHIFPDAGGAKYVNIAVPHHIFPFSWNFEDKKARFEGVWLMNQNYDDEADWSADVAYCLYNKNGQFKKQLSQAARVRSGHPYVSAMDVTMPSAIEDGDQIMLSRQYEDSWQPLPHTRMGTWQFDRTRKLKEMVSAGFITGVESSLLSREDRLFLMDIYKDVYWSVYDEKGTFLFDGGSSSMYLNNNTVKVITMLTTDPEVDMNRVQLRLLPGTYRMVIRNFDETLSFTFTL